MTPIDDMSRQLGRIESSMEGIRADINKIEDRDKRRPCVTHGVEIGKLKVRSGLFGTLGGALAVLLAVIVGWIKK